MGTPETLGQSATQARELGNFSVDTYLDRRATNPSFVMVEIGHGGLPVAYQQNPGFTGQRAYIGIEAWLRDRWNRQRDRKVDQHNALRQGQNIFYVAQKLGGSVLYDEDNPRYSWYEGEYDPKTLLPDGTADEVFLSNVFCDPHIADSRDATTRLLSEAVRLAESSGMIVLRETITPHKTVYLTSRLIDDYGLRVEGGVIPSDENAWSKLEELYKAEPSKMGPSYGSYYLFLSKTTER